MLPVPHLPAHVRTLAASVAGLLSLALWATWLVFSRKPTPAQLEERRRKRLAGHGRIVDGIITDGLITGAESPAVVFYSYRVAGVSYECSQDVAQFGPLDLRLDFPVQVRYDRDNPANSIVLAENWNGLWSLKPGGRPLPQSVNH